MRIVVHNEIHIERHSTNPGWFVVSVADPDFKYGEYVSAHTSYESALAGALKFQKEWAPAVIRDLAGGGT